MPGPARSPAGGHGLAPDARALFDVQHRAGNAAAVELIRPPREPGRQIRNALASPGVPLDGSIRRLMEARTGADLSQVRVHTGAEASRSAAQIGAHAYAVGNDLVFQKGVYAPHTDAGARVLAHELAHVVQQRSEPIAGRPAGAGMVIGERDGQPERAADEAARAALAPRLDTGRGPRRGR